MTAPKEVRRCGCRRYRCDECGKVIGGAAWAAKCYRHEVDLPLNLNTIYICCDACAHKAWASAVEEARSHLAHTGNTPTPAHIPTYEVT